MSDGIIKTPTQPANNPSSVLQSGSIKPTSLYKTIISDSEDGIDPEDSDDDDDDDSYGTIDNVDDVDSSGEYDAGINLESPLPGKKKNHKIDPVIAARIADLVRSPPPPQTQSTSRLLRTKSRSTGPKPTANDNGPPLSTMTLREQPKNEHISNMADLYVKIIIDINNLTGMVLEDAGLRPYGLRCLSVITSTAQGHVADLSTDYQDKVDMDGEGHGTKRRRV